MSEHKSVVNLVSTVDGGTVCKNRKWARASGGERGPVSSVTPCNSNSQLQSARSQNSPRWELLKERKLGGWLWLSCMAAAPPQTAYSKLNYHTSAPEPPALAIPGNSGMVGPKKKKRSFIFGCSSSRTPKALSLLSAGTTTANEVCHISICSFFIPPKCHKSCERREGGRRAWFEREMQF